LDILWRSPKPENIKPFGEIARVRQMRKWSLELTYSPPSSMQECVDPKAVGRHTRAFDD
jgi:hypothetical protein